jgi:isochorismate hydrolase
MQRYFLDRSSHAYLPDSELIIGNVQSLVSRCRELSVPILFTRHAHRSAQDLGNMGSWWGDVIRDGTEVSTIDNRFAPLRGDKVLRKSQYSAFVGTGLEQRLRTRRITQLLITGVMTHLCCETTARDAFMKGFDVFFVVDGTASKTLDLHLSSIKTLTDGFAIPVTTKEVLRWMQG